MEERIKLFALGEKPIKLIKRSDRVEKKKIFFWCTSGVEYWRIFIFSETKNHDVGVKV